MAITNKATITQWDDTKGFGFATANGVKYFFHISALGRPARSPRVGDTVIISSFGKTDRGPRIEKGELEGVPMLASPSYSRQTHATRPRKNKSFRKFMFSLCIILAAISGIYSFAGKAGMLSDPASDRTASHYSTDNQYTTKDEVAKYICDNGYLPPNYVNKSEGKRLYESKTGNTFKKWNFNPLTTLGVMIGGDGFSNHDGLLPPGDYREADVDYFGENRGTKRLVYSSGCNIYYTGDHYGTFTKLSF